MDKLEKTVKQKLAQLIKSRHTSLQSSRFLLMLSGGSDSVALLSCLSKLNLNFYTIHFNHGVLDNSMKVSQFCKKISKNLNSKHHFNFKLKDLNKKNIESVGRKKRYTISKKLLIC